MKFKGFDNYIEIFRGGKQTDSAGKEHDGDALIETAASSFNTAAHEPPAVIGHPKDNAPAYAWVEDLKTEVVDGSKILLAKFKQVVPEFEEMVKKGLFKKRSASFYPDGRLRHVGFLGAMPPAVKGLADIPFSEADEPVTFEFEESWKVYSIGQVLQRLRDFLIEQFGTDKADKVIPTWELDSIKQPSEPVEDFSDRSTNKGEEDMTTYSEEDFNKAVAAAKKEGKDEAVSEFEETSREKRFSDDLARVQEFCDRMVQEGKIAPAWVDFGLKEFMESQAGSEAIEFAEGGKKDPLDWLMDFFENQVPKLVEFKEVAGRDTDLPDVEAEFAECDDEDRLELHRKIKALAKEKEISYSEAADLISV